VAIRNRFLLKLVLISGCAGFLAPSVQSDEPPLTLEPPRQVEALLTDPNILTQDLGDSFGISIPILHPTHSRLLFVNFSGVAEHNIALPPQGMTPDYEA
jgi:hypothetical protein